MFLFSDFVFVGKIGTKNQESRQNFYIYIYIYSQELNPIILNEKKERNMIWI